MALKNNGGSNIGKVSSLPHHPLWHVHLSARTAAHDATAITTIAYTTTTTNPRGHFHELGLHTCRGPP